MARILVIEDHSDFRDTLSAMLRSADHDVRSGSNGREALEMLTADAFDVLVMDVLMPEVDGIEVLRAIEKLPFRPPVVAISGGGILPASLALSLASALGASAVLFKPFYRQELIEAIEGALRTEAVLH
jgi:CheY-like chemotaxis protein